MHPGDLQAAQFGEYPPLARRTALAHLQLLRELPAGFRPFLLKEIIILDWKFPAEQDELLAQLKYLEMVAGADRERALRPFAQLRLPAELESFDAVNAPGQFLERLSAHLWATSQMDTFRSASERYMQQFRAVHGEPAPGSPRLAIVLIGQQVATAGHPLFRKLRREGLYFRQVVDTGDGLQAIVRLLHARMTSRDEAYAHWFIDGSTAPQLDARVTSVSFEELSPIRRALTARIRQAFETKTPPELLRTALAETTPADLGVRSGPQSEVLDRFKLSLFTEGSGTQIYSTTFVQWAAREAMRRAKPLTLVARFAPRQKESPMNELLNGSLQFVTDPAGSLVDGDMGAWYTWISLQRLTGADQSCFLAWFEGHNEAVAIGPAFPRGTENNTPIPFTELLRKLSAAAAHA